MSAQMIPAEIDEFLVQTRPSLKESLHMMVAEAIELDVTNETNFRKMTSIYADSKDWEKRIEFLRKEANGPDQDRINSRNDKAKEILTPLKQLQTVAKQKCEKYQLILEQRKQEEQKKIQQAVDLLGLDDVPMVAPVEKSIRGDGAIMVSRTVRKFRTVDLSKVPLKYLQVDQEAIDRDIKLGVSEIPGIEIYEEKITQLRSR